MSDGFKNSFEPTQSFDPQPPAKNWIGTCLIVCAGVFVVGALVCGGIGFYLYRNARSMGADLAQQGLTEAIRKSDLEEEDKQIIVREIDRVAVAFKNGDIGLEEVGQIMTELAESPLIAVMMVKAAEAKYISKSGLSDDEKADASIVVSRVGRGVVEKKIKEGALDDALNHVSYLNQDGQREFKDTISDDELRAFIEECRAQADAAEIPDEPYEVDIGAEFTRAIDAALSGK